MRLKIYSASEIGEQLGMTRNAVIGTVHRYKKLKEIGLPDAARSNKRKMFARKPLDGGPKPLMLGEDDHIGRCQCRYVHGDPKKEWGYCGHKTVGTTYWCEFHLWAVSSHNK